MKFFYCKSAKGRSGRWAEAAARAKSGISLVGSENRVYSIHRHLDLSSVTDSLGKNNEAMEEIVSNEAGGGSVTGLECEPNPLEDEVQVLKKQITSLQESKHELEEQLAMYNDRLEEKGLLLNELQSLVEAKTTQIEILCRKMDNLQSENRRLETLASEHAFLKSELESIKIKAKETKGEIRRSWRKKKDALIRLQQRMSAQKSRETEMLTREIEMVNIIQGLHGEIEELKKTNLGLLTEKMELMNKLDSIAESIGTEKGATEKANQEVNRLRIANAELQKQKDLYRSGRRNDLEELIYLRWINACLKHELKSKHGFREGIFGTIKHEKGDAKIVDESGVNDQKKNTSSYDSDCSTVIGTEVTESNEDVNFKKNTKSPKRKLLKFKNWMNRDKPNKKIHDEDRCSMSRSLHKLETQDSDSYANVSSCGRQDYATDISVLPKSRDFLLKLHCFE